MSIFKDSFPGFVKDELNKRQQNISNHDFVTVANTISRTAWVRMISGTTINTNPNATKDWILYGGNSQSKNQVLAGYINKGNMGIRPVPGITNMSLDSFSANGSLRKITITFQAWDVDQLNILEKLYMRPGYPVCIEWGWSHNVGDNKSLVTLPIFGENFLKIGTKDSTLNGKSLLELYKIGYDYVSKANGNYDVCIGKVSNYHWEVRSDGGYDCSTTIVTYGEILDSLKSNYVGLTSLNTTGVGLYPPKGSIYASDEEPRPHYERSLLSGLLYEIKMFSLNFSNNVHLIKTKNHIKGEKVSNRLLETTPIDDFVYRIFTTDAVINANPYAAIKPAKKAYILLKDFCRLVNDYIIPQNANGKLTEIVCDGRKLSSPNDKTSTKMLAYPIQLPMDIDKCVFYPSLWANGLKVEPIVNTLSPLNTFDNNQPKYKGLAKIIRNGDIYNIDKIAEWMYVNNGLKANVYTDLGTLVDDLINNPSRYLNKISEYIGQSATKIDAFVVDGAGNISSTTDSIVNQTRSSFQRTIGNNISTKEGWIITLKDSSTVLVNKEFRLIVNDLQPNDLLKVPVFINTTIQKKEGTESRIAFNILNISNFNDAVKKQKLTDFDNFNTLYLANNSKLTQLNAAIISSTINSLFSPIGGYPFFADTNGSSANIGNIFVNIDLILDILNTSSPVDPNRRNEISISNLFNNLLNEIQNSIGSINDLRLHVDPLDNIARIIDMNYVDVSKSDKLFQIQLHNTSSIVKSYKLESMIFPEQSTIIAISAQTKSGTLGYGNQHLVAYNSGLTNRILSDVDNVTNIEAPKNQDATYLLSMLDTIASYYKTITVTP